MLAFTAAGFALLCVFFTSSRASPTSWGGGCPTCPPHHNDPHHNNGFDYVIVGAGPAGFVLAEQLSQDPRVSVLLLEAGADDSSNTNVTIPGFAGNNEFSPRIWDYYTTPQATLDGATPHLAQGKLLGGGTGVNYMNFNRGSSSVFDEWAVISGNDGLAWKNLISDFRATSTLEANSAPAEFKQVVDRRAYGAGPVIATRTKTLDGFDPYWNEALKSALGLPEVDFNSGVGVGVSYGVETIRASNRTRMYALPAYGYQMAGRRNVMIKTNALVTKVNFAGKRAESVTYVDTANGSTINTVRAREIILSAGAIASPKLLMLSGVGPKKHLEAMGIPLVLDSPHVGSNLRDHNYGSLEIQVTPDVYTLSRWQNSTYLKQITQEFLQNAGGPLANAPASSFALVRVPNGALPAGPEGRFQRSLPQDRGQLQMQYANVALLANTSEADVPVMTPWVALVQPEATGTVRLKSRNPLDFPLIDTNYFGSPGDRAAVLWGYRKLREVIAASPLKDIVVKEIYPGPQAQSDAGLWKAIQGGAQSYHHPMGTCALGTVLDADWRVRGLQGLRVVDASTFPTPPNCHPQADVYAVAHLAARQIAEADSRWSA